MPHEHFKDLPRRIASEKILLDKAFNFIKNPKYDGYQYGPASLVYNFFIRTLLHLQIVCFQ